MKRQSSAGSTAYGIGYAAFVASLEIFSRGQHYSNALALVQAASFLAFVVHLALWPRETLSAFTDRLAHVRGIAFGAGNVAVILAARAAADTQQLALATGTAFCILLGPLCLREKTTRPSVAAAVVLLAALLLECLHLRLSGIGLLAGGLFAVNFILSRALMARGRRIRRVVPVGFAWSLVLLACATTGEIDANIARNQLNFGDVLTCAGLAIAVQYGFFLLFRAFDARRASILNVLRLSWSHVWLIVFVGTATSALQLGALALSGIGALLLFCDGKLPANARSPAEAIPRWLVVVGLAALTTFCAFFVPLSRPGLSLLHDDWHYFYTHPLFIRSCLFGYHRLPLHDPWGYGGIDFLAVPQSRVFSPLVLLGLLADPDRANILSLCVFCFFGFLGMYALLKELGVSRVAALIVAMLYLNCGWFTLHHIEGHISFGSLQLLPWVIFCGYRVSDPKRLLGLVSLLSFLMIDGSFYVCAFSLLLLATLYATTLWRRGGREALAIKRRDLPFAGLCVLCAALLCSAKLIPVFAVFPGTREPQVTSDSFSLAFIARIFFWPFFDSTQTVSYEQSPRFVDYGCYVGIPSALLLAWAASQKPFLRRNSHWFAMLAFWFWVGTCVGPIRGWDVLLKLPFVRDLSHPARLLVLFATVYMILLGLALEQLRRRNVKAFAIVALLLACESLVVHTRTYLRDYATIGVPTYPFHFITNHSLTQTARYNDRPFSYDVEGLGSQTCYEPMWKSAVRGTGASGYRGEVYVDSGKGEVRISSFVPGKLSLEYKNDSPLRAVVNTNVLGGWNVTAGAGSVSSTPDKLLVVNLPAGSGSTTIEYSPRYLPFAVAFYLAGLALWVWLVVKILALKNVFRSNDRSSVARHRG